MKRFLVVEVRGDSLGWPLQPGDSIRHDSLRPDDTLRVLAVWEEEP